MGAMLEMTSEGNFFMAYRQDPMPESERTAGRFAREGESVRSKAEGACYDCWRAGLSKSCAFEASMNQSQARPDN